MDEATYLHHSEKDELAKKLFNLEHVNKNSEIHYLGEIYSGLFKEYMKLYHHKAGSTFFLSKDYIVLIGKRRHNLAARKSLEIKLRIKLE